MNLSDTYANSHDDARCLRDVLERTTSGTSAGKRKVARIIDKPLATYQGQGQTDMPFTWLQIDMMLAGCFVAMVAAVWLLP